MNLLSGALGRIALGLEIDLFGIASHERLSGTPVADYIKATLNISEYNVVVVGVRFFDASVERAGERPAESVTSYSFLQYQITHHLSLVAGHIARFLEEGGHFALPVLNFSPSLPKVVCPYGQFFNLGLPDIRANSIIGVAAGLGELGLNGFLITPGYGPRQRIAGIITDADLEPSPLYEGERLCDGCLACLKACPVSALSETIQVVNIAGKEFQVLALDYPLCMREVRHGQTGRSWTVLEWREEILLSKTPPKTTGSCGHTVIEECLKACMPPLMQRVRKVKKLGTKDAL